MQYPHCRRTDHTDILHGMTIPDPYRWMEDIDSAETQEWINAQNEITFSYLKQIPIRQAILERMTHLWDFEKFGVPFQHGGRYFFTRNDGLQNQAVLYWLESLQAEPRLLLDPNTLSADGTVALTGAEVSHDGRLLAYGLSASGSDWQEWQVRSVDSGEDLPDVIRWVKFSGASWNKDNQGFYYSRYDQPASDGEALKDSNYNQKLYYHRMGDAQTADVLVYQRPDHKEWGFDGRVSEDGRYLVIHVWLGTNRENGVFYLDLQEGGQVVELLNAFDAAYTFISNEGSTFYFLTDHNAPNGRVIGIDLNHPTQQSWKEIIPQSPDALEQVNLIDRQFAALYHHDAYDRVALYWQDGGFLRDVDLPGMGTVAGFSGAAADKETFFLFTSFTTPGTVYHYSLESHQCQVFRAPQVDFDPDDYITEQVFYPSKDGTSIPMFLSYKKGMKRDGSTPTYLYGYGGFNISLTPTFSVSNLVWMEMGGIYAHAILRGGGEYGKAWHDGGRLRNKQNVFDDFIAAAEWLIAQGYTSTPRLAIGGRSNGGLLIGACLTQRPDLFGACLPVVGVLDMLRFHKFTIGWAWTSDYGSPEEAEDFKTLLAYSPYHNIRPGTAYPPTLITTGDHDDRVYPAHSFKFAAALQAAQAGAAPVLIRIDTKAGHGVGKPTAKLIEEFADCWAFLLHSLGIQST